MVSQKILDRFTALGNKNYNTGRYVRINEEKVMSIPANKDTYIKELQNHPNTNYIIQELRDMSIMEWIVYRRKLLRIK